MSQVEQGKAQLAAGNLDQAITAFWGATQAKDCGIEPWYGLAVGLARAHRWAELLQVVDTMDPQVLFFKEVCLRLRIGLHFDVLRDMQRALPETHIVSPLADYYAGVALIGQKRYLESLDYFHRFKLLMLHNLEIYQPHLAHWHFKHIFRQGTLVEPLSVVAAMDDGSYPPVADHVPELTIHRRAEPGGGPLIYACCLNDLYFLRFAESLTATLEAACGAVVLHFNVMGRQADCLPLFETLRQRHPRLSLGLSLEPDPLALTPIYYACNRYFATPQLADLYDRDIIMLDADGLVRQDLGALHRRLVSEVPRPDFACFDTGRPEPASVYQATLMYFARSPGCRAFLRLLQRFIAAKVNQPAEISWLLDQSAMFSVSLYLEHTEGKDFVFRRLDELTGEDLGAYVDSDGTDDEKEVLYKSGLLKAEAAE